VIRFVLLLCTLVCLNAQSGLTISEAIREAVQSHPRIAAAEARVASAQGLRRQAGLRPNPQIILQSENTRFWGTPGFNFAQDTDDFAYLSQLFETAGKRSHRLEVAGARVGSAEIEQAVITREIAARVSLAYWSAAAAAGLRDLLQQDLVNFEKIVQYHRDRVREGAMAEVDLMRILLEQDRLSVAARNAALEANRAVIALLREMGRSDLNPVPLADSVTRVREVPPPDVQSVLSQRVEVEYARRSVQETRARVGLEQALAKPDPTVFFGYKRTAGFNTLMGGMEIALPFRNRNQGGIAAAQASVRASEAQLAAIERTVRAEVATAWTDYESRRRLLEETLEPMRRRADEISRIALEAYRQGGTDLLRLLDAERARIESLVTCYKALSELQQSATTLLIVTGATL
jgi:cobalt-zinc-cadmium efflux system outer membrane protein